MTRQARPKCEEILSAISAFLDDDRDATICHAIDQHCQVCARCAAVVKGLREAVGLCRQAASTPLPDAVRQRARESVRRLLENEQNGDTSP